MFQGAEWELSGFRDLLLQGGAEGLTDAGLLSVIVGERAAGTIESLLHGSEISTSLWSLTGEDLVSIEGVGPAGAARVLACREMGRSKPWLRTSCRTMRRSRRKRRISGGRWPRSFRRTWCRLGLGPAPNSPERSAGS